MPLTIDVDSVQVENTVAQLQANIELLQPQYQVSSTILNEFVAWQEQDMRRKFPNVTAVDDMTAMTRIWPRSRLTQQRANTGKPPQRPGRQRGRRLAAPTIVRKGQVIHHARPILRPEMYSKLRERMRMMLRRVAPWA